MLRYLCIMKDYQDSGTSVMGCKVHSKVAKFCNNLVLPMIKSICRMTVGVCQENYPLGGPRRFVVFIGSV